ncbi:PaiB family negative transcriptional regulator [Planifilum fimeticola]|uniref:PaiB family negative transcriptional regulator n=1 Tax=Planifilum fimeticola TaxID=201975 RepID=A0A2T0LEE4_9BACL|nr:FMN-binding negative transcriptional regulator [Planifilum fimeticola]PRX40466.1 PaiB family negative transcriptional regulator [Planifilum fimeticola]
MYIPKPFAMNDRESIVRFIRENSFGILFSQGNGRAAATHLPFLFKEREGRLGTLYGHMARANPQWKSIDREVLVVFPGPHAYISPAWYGEENTVPTWNYVAVHVYGTFRIIEDEETMKRLLRETIHFYESEREDPWQTDPNREFFKNLMKATVGFCIEITEIQGKWKLNQNHPIERRKRVIEGLKREDRYDSGQIARLMEDQIK